MSTDAPFRQFVSPPLYVQGPGAIRRLGEISAKLGKWPLIVTDKEVARLLAPQLFAALGDATPILLLEGEITPRSLARLTAEAVPLGCDVVFGVGGGKALDAGKAVARDIAAKIVTVPTIASNDAATSQAIAYYGDDDHRFLVDQLGRNPDAVVADTSILAAAPAYFLRCGIGDAIAKFAEAEGAAASPVGRVLSGALPSVAGLASTRAARAILHDDAEAALALCGTGQPDAGFERVIEAVIQLSGVGFENGGLGVAHAMTRGLMLATRTSRHAHGEHVAYGLLVMLALEDSDARLRDEAAFLRRVGLPTGLGAFGAGLIADDEVIFLAGKALTAPQHILNYGRPLDGPAIANAIHRVERLYSETM